MADWPSPPSLSLAHSPACLCLSVVYSSIHRARSKKASKALSYSLFCFAYKPACCLPASPPVLSFCVSLLMHSLPPGSAGFVAGPVWCCPNQSGRRPLACWLRFSILACIPALPSQPSFSHWRGELATVTHCAALHSKLRSDCTFGHYAQTIFHPSTLTALPCLCLS